MCPSIKHSLKDVSGNALDDISALSALPHLLTIKADHNRLTSAKLQEVNIPLSADCGLL